MTSTSRSPSWKVTIVDAMSAVPAAASGASCSSARPTKRPVIRRRYHSVAIASVKGSALLAAAAAAAAIASAPRPVPTSGRSARGPGGDAAGRAEGDPRVGDAAFAARRTATVTTAGVSACLRPNLRYAVGALATARRSDEELVGREHW